MMKRFVFAGTVSTFAAAVLVACGGGGEPLKAATSDLTVAISPATATAATTLLTAVDSGFTFSNGIPELGATGSTTLKVTGTGPTPAFTLTSGGDTASGTLSYGSCIFTVATVSKANLGSVRIQLTVGQQITIPNCNVVAQTAGARTNTDLSNTGVTFRLGVTSSSGTASTVSATIDANGLVRIGSITLGTVNLVAVSGT